MMEGADDGIGSTGCITSGSAFHAGTPLTDIRRWRIFSRGTDRDVRLHEASAGGARIIYCWKPAAGRIFLLYLYPKNVRSDMSRSELRILCKLVTDDE